ncbi:MAG: hypothetical protein Q8M00_01895 [bacterium]|nr:hypothetical protein [bacterium]
MKSKRAAYWREFKKIAIDPKMAKELPEYEIIELSVPVGIPVRWKERVIRKEGKVWREYQDLAEYQPGEVLHREWRRASSWEVEEWNGLSSEALRALGVFKRDGEYFIQIVEKIKDLRAAIRQRCRHILARKISRTQQQFELLGDAQLLENYVSRLTSLVQKILQIRRSSDVFKGELGQIALQLKGAESELKRHALFEIQRAQEQQKPWKLPVHASQAATDLLQERAKDFEIAISSLELAEKWFRLMTDIERRFYNCYQRLGQLGQRLQEEMLKGEKVSPNVLLPIAQEAYGIRKYLLEQIPNFDPYYSRLQEPEFQRLGRVLEHFKQRRAKTVYNDIEGAIAKLEAIAIGEKPTRAEISRQKERFSIGPSKE